MNFFRSIPMMTRWLPVVYSAVVVIEEIVGPGRTGEEKKALALGWLREQSDRLGLPWGPQAIEILSDLIDTVVGVMNFLGEFRHAGDHTDEELAESEEAARRTDAAMRDNLATIASRDEDLARFMEGREGSL